MHEVVGAHGDHEEVSVVVPLRLETARLAVLIDDTLDAHIGRMPVVLHRNRPSDSAVLIGLGELGDERLHRLEGRAAVGVGAEIEVGVVRREREVVDAR